MLYAITWRPDPIYRDEEKIDGQFHMEPLAGDHLLVGEKIQKRTFVAFDLVQHEGKDIRHLPLRDRLALLDHWSPSPSSNIMASSISRPPVGVSGGFSEKVVDRGGEGIVRKLLSARYGQMQWKAKREQDFQVRVTQIHCQSVSLC